MVMGEKKRVSNAAGKKKVNNTKNGRRPSTGRKRRRGMTPNQFILIMAVIVGIILVIAVSKIMQNRYMKVTKTDSEYTLGTPFDIKNYVQPVNDKATIECDETDFQPDKVGPYKVKYTVRCGKLKKHNTVTIEVVDHDFPEITGPEKLGVFKGESVDLLKYYDVNDSEPNLADKLTIDQEIDTSEGGYTDYTLRVIDWGNNSASRTITIGVFDFTDNQKAVALAVREYNREYSSAVSEGGVYYMSKDDDTAYVLIGSDNVYEVGTDNSCDRIDADKDLIQSIQNSGTWMEIGGYSYFNYNIQE